MEKFLHKQDQSEYLSKKLSGYIGPGGVVYLTDPRKVFVKRLVDLVFSFLFLVFILSWLFPLVAALIKLDSSGPVLFKQLRHGKGNTAFWCYKFRTMKRNDEADTRQASRHDRRVTRMGKFLRKTSLDETPQFFNVLLGDMSVIGPRPHAVPMNHLFSNEINNYMFRHSVKPGITGLAQVKGYRGEILRFYDIYGRVRLDHFYIKNWSLLLDAKILVWTISAVFLKNANVY
ncbi:putative colanic acid biosysnthesis UDP-glucose lipid carrier transferase [Cyclobacterium xiamenense]|uniref:Putative colanic acid biosysnthesis UDP-glucose lipid carrier transferase n=1 Tax=Cyclobacterium xiamenense TaxID=1297121 RepID=A0A1H7AT70_9BACT|nr:sugar transferase [Cyclobacterium xiamenense]SEJ68793.1 putative colanic acid biosysnthesis UDP-glucose lipid carrier transferase [Cyclobacterium xiamenense]